VKVLTDLHHGVLFESLAMLFVDRAILGPAELLVWVDGYYVTNPGIIHADFPPREVRAVTTEYLKDHRPEYVIATAGTNRHPMRDLAERLGARYVDHLGNQDDQPIGDLVLRAMLGDREQGLTYHPEFHRLRWSKPEGRRVGAFHASFLTLPCRSDWDRVASDEWVMYGTPETALEPWQVAKARKDCIAAWVCKDADGYGFAVHEAFASGRAVIGHASHYEGKMAELLFVRGETYLEPGDDLGPMLADPVPMGRAAFDRFDELVNFDAEAAAIADYLS
jgi:hypothetical protein